MKGDREKCLEAGHRTYLAKPVNTEQLLLAIRMWLPPLIRCPQADDGPRKDKTSF